jgi:hypothetical protein
MRKKGQQNFYRGIRKGANISRRAFSKASGLSGRVENKANRYVLEKSSFKAKNTVPFEKIYAESLPEVTPIYPALPLADRKPSVTLLIPSLHKSAFFGGAATALIVAAMLAKNKSYNLRIVETLKHGRATPQDLTEFLKSSSINWDETTDIKIINLADRRYNHYGYLDIHPEDLFIASAWWDAQIVSQLPLKRKFVYLIQDFEPIFYNNSDRYALAEATYGLDNYVALCNTKLMYDFMVNRGYKKVSPGAWFEPAVAKKTPGAKKKSPKKKLFLYGRPNVERNLFNTALAAINRVFSERSLDPNEWEVVMAGQDELPDIKLESGVVVSNLGKMDSSDYIKLLNETDLALSPMMAPHPNYPTLEFAASGAAVVTTKYDIKQDLSSYSDNIIMCDISEESMAKAIEQAASLKTKNTSRVESDWTKALSAPIAKIIKEI